MTTTSTRVEDAKPSKRAFAVTEHDENTGLVYFARHDIEARRLGATEFAEGELSYVSCVRAPWADAYAESGRLPARVSIENGWHFECYGCGERIDSDWLYDRRLPVSGVVGFQTGPVYCNSSCAAHHISLKRRTRLKEAEAISDLKAVVLRRLPHAEFAEGGDWPRGHHAFVQPHRGGAWNKVQVVVAIKYPGAKYGPAHFRMDQQHKYGPPHAHYSVANGDREVFEAWAALRSLSQGAGHEQ